MSRPLLEATGPGAPVPAPPGMAQLPVADSVAAAVARLEGAIAARGLRLFARIDFAADAGAAGLPMPPSLLFVFGSPKAGTPLMVAAPTIALDLPLKILVYEDQNGRPWVGYNTPEYLGARHQLPAELLANIEGVRALATLAAGAIRPA